MQPISQHHPDKPRTILLVNPPVAKPSEPPPGIARLAGCLKAASVSVDVLDASIEGLLHLMGTVGQESVTDRWTRRAVRTLDVNLGRLKTLETYGNFDRYSRAVVDLNRLLTVASARWAAKATLSDFQSESLSPVRSQDLIRAFETPEINPFHPYFSRRLPEALAASGADTVGLSLNFLSQALTTFAMAGFLRREAPALRIVLGGGLVTSWMRRPGWQNPFSGLIDHMIDGPGEGPLLALMNARVHGPSDPLPDYSGLPVDRYLSPGRVIPYSTSSGCYWQKCAFCPERAEGNPYRPVPVPVVLRHLSALAAAHDPSMLHLLDNALSPKLLKALIETPPGVPWYGFVRVSPHLTNPDFCHALKRAGCVMLKLGVESGDQRVLDLENKGVDVEMSSKALKTLRQAGIATYVYLLFGTPAESEESAHQTLQFAVQHSQCISFMNLAIFNLPLNGPEAAELKTVRHSEGDLSLYTDFVHPKGWNRADVRRFLDREFRRHPALMPILRRDPPLFTSNHAAFLGP